MMDFTRLTDEELEKAKESVIAEMDRRKEVEKELAIEELEKLLERVNELQNKYNFKITCLDSNGCYELHCYHFELC